MPDNYSERRQNDSEVRIIIEEIRGSLNVILTKIDALTNSVERLNQTSITREELKLTIDPMEARIKGLEDFKNTVLGIIGLIAFGVLAGTIAHAIPGINL
jgi:GTP-binding protein EngB required for normal cell division